MILLIYDKKDYSTLEFMEYLREKKVKHISIAPDDILSNKNKILDLSKKKCVWNIEGIKIEFDKLSGIYFRIHDIAQNKYFKQYNKEDIEYVINEWWSYLIYRVGITNNVINPITNESLSGVVLEIPYIYQIAEEIGFVVPEYYFSNSYKELEYIFNQDKKFIVKTSINNNTDFRASSYIYKNAIGLIEALEGKICFIHILDSEIFGCFIHQNNRKTLRLTSKEKVMCFTMKEKLRTRALQIILIDNRIKGKVFVHASLYPNWLLAEKGSIAQIYQSLLYKLTSNKS